MEGNDSFARRLRIGRLRRHDNSRLFVVPLDHSVTNGPIAGTRNLNDLTGQLTAGGVDAVVLHKGVLRHIDPRLFVDTALIVHLSAGTQQALDPDAKYLVAGVEEALRMGADAVSTHLNLGSAGEQRQIADLAAVAAASDQWNVPLMAMVYPRGPKISNPRDPDLVAHAVTVAADLGADVVKTILPDPPAALADIVAGSPVPVVVAGGAPATDPGDVLAHVRSALNHGASGVAIGRNVFQAQDPPSMVRKLSQLIHGLPTGPDQSESRPLLPMP